MAGPLCQGALFEGDKKRREQKKGDDSEPRNETRKVPEVAQSETTSDGKSQKGHLEAGSPSTAQLDALTPRSAGGLDEPDVRACIHGGSMRRLEEGGGIGDA